MEEEEEISPGQEIDFCTMGMFIIGKNTFGSVNLFFVFVFFQALSTGPKVAVATKYFAVAMSR
jgi:hypothetical protein